MNNTRIEYILDSANSWLVTYRGFRFTVMTSSGEDPSEEEMDAFHEIIMRANKEEKST